MASKGISVETEKPKEWSDLTPNELMMILKFIKDKQLMFGSLSVESLPLNEPWSLTHLNKGLELELKITRKYAK